MIEVNMRRCITLAERAANSGNYALGALVMMNGDVLAESDSSLVGADNEADAVAWSTENPDDVYTWRQIEISAGTVLAAGHPRLVLKEGLLRVECNQLFRLSRSRT
jgi:hypothetical protein